MAVVGCLGDIAFTVSDSTVRTVNNLSWSGSARYAVHQRHLEKGLAEFTGVDPDKITFDMTLSSQLGMNPVAEMEKIRRYESKGKALPLTLGYKAYGSYRWVITRHSLKAQAHDRNGAVSLATLSITLQEYLRR